MDAANHSGHFMTGRNPDTLANLINNSGDAIWMGPDGNADRGDRYSHRPYKPPTEGPPPVTDTDKPRSGNSKAIQVLQAALRTDTLGQPGIDPIDADAPRGTQIRRIAAYNALIDLARPGIDRYCARVGSAASGAGPCVLKDGHRSSDYDDSTAHMDSEQRDRALRYLIHSDPDPEKRA